ncbi:AraC family transcriptional regulator [Arachnia propionica]|uniref:AraC family transcriptional regulator n=2 Tax=Arachnia propionica TaxID=1750 RepID=A0A3P1TDB6_9ACTN|nr:AraC family transcriptional regulator [Arachnia propionica]
MGPGPMAGSTDRLARVLHTLRMRSIFYSHAELAEPWAFEMPAIPDSISVHIITTGTCWLRLPGAVPLQLHAGDLALVPHGLGHDLASAEDGGPVPRVDLLPQQYLTDHYSVLRHGGSGRAAQMICSVVSFDDPAARELMRALPSVLHIGGDAVSTASSIHDTVRLMAGELSELQPGGEAVATRLADILVIQAIRAWLTTASDTGAGWLRAIQDPRIGRVLEAIHAEPGREWTLGRLAQTATMSRSSFSTRFTELVGEAPIAYLTRWRMNIAHTRLRDENITAARLATEVGYRSEAGFNRAFARIIGSTPGSIRRQR